MTKAELFEVIEYNTVTLSHQRAIKTAVEAYSSASNSGKPIVSGSLPPDEFADMLLRDFEISTFDNGDLCWQLAGTKQNYTSGEIYKILSGNDH